MTAKLPYDAAFDPPAPVIAVRISGPLGNDGVVVPMLVDTGADCTVLPSALVQGLRLPQTGVVGVRGVGGTKLRATTHAATLELAGTVSLVAEVMEVDDEPILGRDVLNQLVIVLDGPARWLSIRSRPQRRSKTRSAGATSRSRPARVR